MGAVLLSPLYLLLNFYLDWRILGWLAALHPFFSQRPFMILFSVLYGAAMLTPLLSMALHGTWKKRIRQFSNYWLAFLMYGLLFFLLAEAGRLALYLLLNHAQYRTWHPVYERIAGGAVLLCTAGVIWYGIHHALQMRHVIYDVTIDKECPIPELNIVLLADLHLGYNTRLLQIYKMKRMIEDIQPRMIVWAGDIFDNEFAAIRHPRRIAAILKSLSDRCACGSYACWGNHDVEEAILAGFTFSNGNVPAENPQMYEFLKEAGIRMLEDETVLIDDAFYLTGRLDASGKIAPHTGSPSDSNFTEQPDEKVSQNFSLDAWQKKSETARLTPEELLCGLDTNRPMLVIDHQPSQLDALSAAGADLVLSGHTHDGQLFPGSIATRITWTNSYGMQKFGNMTSIVTSGVGLWGPAMRIGTTSEVVEVRVHFSGESSHSPHLEQ
jgi:predicted MPP superfamily phosphohydrolase